MPQKPTKNQPGKALERNFYEAEYAEDMTNFQVNKQFSSYSEPKLQPEKAFGSIRPDYELYPGE